MIKSNNIRLPLAVAALAACSAASAVQLQVSITNNATPGGTYLTPVWVGFHDGSFDTFDAGSSSSAALEAIAEDGNASALVSSFSGFGVDGGVGGGPIAPGQTVNAVFDVAADGSQNYFSFASMLLPSSDFFIGNDGSRDFNLASLLDGSVNRISFDISTAYDAGTEVNDFATSAANPLFGIPGGQTGPNQGADENGVVTAITGADFLNFLNAEGIDVSTFNFDNYGSLATIEISTVSQVPVPAALPLFASALGLLTLGRRRALSKA